MGHSCLLLTLPSILDLPDQSCLEGGGIVAPAKFTQGKESSWLLL